VVTEMKKEEQQRAFWLSAAAPAARGELYSLRKADIDKACGVLFEAFQDDPFFLYAFGKRHNDKTLVSMMHRFTLRLGLRYGLVQSPTAAIEGVAIWLSPGHASITPSRAVRAGVFGLGMHFLKEGMIAGSFIQRMAAFSTFSDQLHKRHAHLPHWYLLAIGIDRRDRGKGYGSRLLRPMLARCDSERLPCYLETHNEANLELYRHFGFQIMEEGWIPRSDTRQWAMLRMPQQLGSE
jgi:ribosomal protein S18 acetylase RimI-like enzyme